MKKFIKIFFCLFIIFILGGCLSKETKEKVKKIEADIQVYAIDYLKNNYNVSSITNLHVRFHNEDGPFGAGGSEMTDYVTGKFTKNGNEYDIICNYKINKCYDSLAYKNKINPILTKKIYNDLKDYNHNTNLKPNYVNIKVDGVSRFISNDYYSVFNNEDIVNSYEEIIEYYNELGEIEKIHLTYNSNNKIITNNLNVYKNLNNKYNIPIQAEVYHDDNVLNEYLYISDSEIIEYYSMEVVRTGGYIVSWKKEAQEKYNSEIGNFEVNLVKNINSFSKGIEIDDKKYSLFSQNVLEVKDIGEDKSRHVIYLETNKNVCEKSIIVYNEKGEYKELSTLGEVRFDENEKIKRFAIYCEQ